MKSCESISPSLSISSLEHYFAVIFKVRRSLARFLLVHSTIVINLKTIMKKAVRQDSATSDFVEVDFDENEMGNFAGSFLSPSRHHEDDVHIRPSTVGALWLFSFNIAPPLFMMTATTISGIGANNTSSSILLPWFADGHNLGLMHAIVFVITLLIWTLVTHVHRRNRAHGFLTFYRNTRRIKDAPLLAIGLGNGLFKKCSSRMHNTFLFD